MLTAAILASLAAAFFVSFMLGELDTGPAEAYVFWAAAKLAAFSGAIAAGFWFVLWRSRRRK
ncbi:MAG: hypothetical protein DCC68_18530 [Planctomycetota bacterium]|nr:MAG: hypothetical protein DCC68_18530 [Planctomycetota bacterium]